MTSQSTSDEVAPLRITFPTKNRRATVRYLCAPATPGKIFAPDDVEFQRAWIINLSKGGVGLVLNKMLPVGLQLVLNIRCNQGDKEFRFLVEIVRVCRQVTGDVFLGCRFVELLNETELDLIL